MPLSSIEKNVLKIDETSEFAYEFNIKQVENDIVDSDPVVCIIPHTCDLDTTCKITVSRTTEVMYIAPR